jgi:hypothetical protein
MLAELWWVAAADAGEGKCPSGLLEDAQFYRTTLQDVQWAVRDSPAGAARGVVETVQFDRRSHACHEGPGQAYREFGEPVCLPANSEGRVPVRFAYRLFYRQAMTLDALFKKDWKQGSDGAIEVEFEADGGRWIAVGKRELLDVNRPAHVREQK